MFREYRFVVLDGTVILFTLLFSETVDLEPFSFMGILLMAKTLWGTGVSRIKMSIHLLGRAPSPCRRETISIRLVS